MRPHSANGSRKRNDRAPMIPTVHRIVLASSRKIWVFNSVTGLSQHQMSRSLWRGWQRLTQAMCLPLIASIPTLINNLSDREQAKLSSLSIKTSGSNSLYIQTSFPPEMYFQKAFCDPWQAGRWTILCARMGLQDSPTALTTPHCSARLAVSERFSPKENPALPH